MRMSYQTNDELSYQDVNADLPPHLRLVRRESIPHRAGRALGALLTLATVIVIPYILLHDFARVNKATGIKGASAVEMKKTSQFAMTSLEGLVRRALDGAAYLAGWSKLVARNLGDFEDAASLIKTPYDPRHPSEVESRRRQGAQALVAVLERNGLLSVMSKGVTRDELALHIAKLLNIEPTSVSRSFREAQEAQVGAIRSALERHMSDVPGPSDLAVFSGAPSPTTASAK